MIDGAILRLPTVVGFGPDAFEGKSLPGVTEASYLIGLSLEAEFDQQT